jgi:hypothetical protein
LSVIYWAGWRASEGDLRVASLATEYRPQREGPGSAPHGSVVGLGVVVLAAFSFFGLR